MAVKRVFHAVRYLNEADPSAKERCNSFLVGAVKYCGIAAALFYGFVSKFKAPERFRIRSFEGSLRRCLEKSVRKDSITMSV